MRRTRRFACVVVIGVSAGLVAGACGGDSKTSGASSAASASTSSSTLAATSTTNLPATSTSPASKSTTTTAVGNLAGSTVSGKSELPDGRHFGYWSTFEVGDTVAFGEFDLAYFLTGPAAVAAAAKKGQTVENDYFIVNDNPKLVTLIAHGDTKVRVLTDGSSTLHASNVADFAVDRHKNAGFWVTIKNGIVTDIEEQFQP